MPETRSLSSTDLHKSESSIELTDISPAAERRITAPQAKHPDQIVYLVDDDEPFRLITCRLLESSGFKTLSYGSAAEFLEANNQPLRGCLILDIRMPGSDGFALQEVMNRRNGTLPIIFLTGYGDIPMSVKGIKGGALDFLSKPTTREILIPAVENALAQESEMWESRGRHKEWLDRLSGLSVGEREVFIRMMTGRSSKQISEELGSDAETVSNDRTSVLRKMGVTTTAQLVREVHLLRLSLGEESYPTVRSLFGE